jgi:hypothetical protein
MKPGMSKMVRDVALIRIRFMKRLGTGRAGALDDEGHGMRSQEASALVRCPGKFPARSGKIPCWRAASSLFCRAGNLPAPRLNCFGYSSRQSSQAAAFREIPC